MSSVINIGTIILETAMDTDTTIRIEYVFNPYLLRRHVVGFYGRGGTGKSSFIATLAIEMSKLGWGTLWVSTEEPDDWIRVRHIAGGGRRNTLHVVKAVVTGWDASGRPISSNFNVYEHLEPAIETARATSVVQNQPPAPLGLVVLDTAVALTTWKKTETPNDDAGVKRLLSYLMNMAEKYDLCNALTGHSNKGKHEQLADTVAGAAAWVNFPRQSFIHLRDARSSDERFVIMSPKANTGYFAQQYSTRPVHNLHERPDGNHNVLCTVDLSAPIVWGRREAQILVDEVMGKDPDDSFSLSPAMKKQMAINEVVRTVMHLLDAGTEPVNRKTIEEALGRKVNNRHWPDVETALALTCNVFPVTGLHGELFYEKK